MNSENPVKKAILMVSHGTADPDALEKCIGTAEDAVQKAFPEYTVGRAFQSRRIIEALRVRTNTKTDYVTQALNRLLEEKTETVILQPTVVTYGEEYTHMNVAAAVLSGRAHTGLAVRAAACALGLDFVPVGVEEYDLVIPQRYAEDERILALLDVIRSEAFRKEVAALGGYGVEKTGQVIWEYDGR